jgi:hypothetical protein
MDMKNVRRLACGCVVLVGAGAVVHSCRKPDEGVEEMPNTISVSEPYLQQTNTAAHMIGSYLSLVQKNQA